VATRTRTGRSRVLCREVPGRPSGAARRPGRRPGQHHGRRQGQRARPAAMVTGRPGPSASPRWPAEAAGRLAPSSPPRTPPRGCRGPSWACCPSCPHRCRRGPPRQTQDTVTETPVVDHQTHCCPARNAHAATAATASPATLRQAGGDTDPESGTESRLRRRPPVSRALRPLKGSRPRCPGGADACPDRVSSFGDRAVLARCGHTRLATRAWLPGVLPR
jgi:hypothetical protein